MDGCGSTRWSLGRSSGLLLFPEASICNGRRALCECGGRGCGTFGKDLEVEDKRSTCGDVGMNSENIPIMNCDQVNGIFGLKLGRIPSSSIDLLENTGSEK